MSSSNTVLLQVIVGILLPVGALLSVVIWSLKNGIVPMPTTRVQRERMMQNLPEDPGEFLFDLGSGFGTLAIALARRYPKSVVVGVESSPVPFWISALLKMIFRLENLTLRREDIMNTSIVNASAVVVYLHRAGMPNLKTKLQNELKPGVWIVSNTFAFPDWEPEKVIVVGDINKTKIYVYRS
ncbi:MAG TPA: SAM-dependent methyltransferase [Acidobacteriota bacterium]|nr:SAM-dependent methyltransferase [Acidobacteriota bacterium]